MTIDKAIEILQYMVEHRNVASLEDCIKGVQLGIEALKRELDYRKGFCTSHRKPLPGETED